MPSRAWWIAYSAYSLATLATANWLNYNVPNPYMDELIHIPQAQAYCNNQWLTWDDRLTTPPGLYLSSYLVSRLLQLVQYSSPASSSSSNCSTLSLRSLNTLFLLLLPLLHSTILHQIRHSVLRPSTRGKTTPSRRAIEQRDRGEESWEALALALFPVLGFFGFLYYTDVQSTSWVLLGLLLAKEKIWYASALACLISLLFRQTNILWIVFIAASSVVHQLEPKAELYDLPLSKARFPDVPASLLSLLLTFLNSIPTLLPILISFVPIGAIFLSFLIWNEGIVLGDKSNHIPTIHIPQLWYFIAFEVAFLSPILLSFGAVREAVGGLAGSGRRIFFSTVVLVGMVLSIKHFTIAHPFVLSDNRHYVFYLWRRVINRTWWARYALTPGYLVGARMIYDRLAASSTLTLLPFLLYIVSISLSLIPTPLLEPRYFLLPHLILRLHLRPRGISRKEMRLRLLLEATLNIAVLAGTIWVFGKRSWKISGFEGDGIGRFMW
ncbi:hypothetical protein T439DRAFT_380588 [Meredithblackwellia eburnea MCA 4105]